MENKSIIIKIENYADEPIEFIIPSELNVSILRGRSLIGITYLDIAVLGNDELTIEER